MAGKKPGPPAAAQAKLDAIGTEGIAPSIYGLYDKQGRLRYIGKANHPGRRLAGHMRASKKLKSPLYDWIRKHGQPEMRVLEADCADWRASERAFIASARLAGLPLLNLADGGDEPFCPPEVRAAHGRRLNARGAMAETDPFAYARREFLKRLGMRGASALKTAASNMDGELLAYRLSKSAWGIKFFPAWCREELLKGLA